MIDFTIPDLVLVVIAVLTIAAAIASLEAKEIVYGAVSLGGMFLGLACLFVLLDATYAAMFQITVYIGAVAVLILFTIMVVPYDMWRQRLKRPAREWVSPLVINVLLLISLSFLFLTSGTVTTNPPAWSWTIDELAIAILSDYGVALLILGLVLTAALIGALTLSKKEAQE